MAQTTSAAPSANAETSSPSGPSNQGNFSRIRNWFRKSQGASAPPSELPRAPESLEELDEDDPQRFDNTRRVSRKPAIPGLPRVQTFKRQQSEKRNNLAPIQPTLDERRAASVDRRVQQSRAVSQPAAAAQAAHLPRSSAPEFWEEAYEIQSAPSIQTSPVEERPAPNLAHMVQGTNRPQSVISDSHEPNGPHDSGKARESAVDVRDADDVHSITDSQYHELINEELEKKWILNLSMHFRDKSKREKFFVTYRQSRFVWRRVTVSVDYRNAPDNSLERDLATTKFQRDKSAKIYEAIRDSLQDIQFYESVTNLKLQTLDGRLHVHVVEDVNEIINYPYARQVQHLGCRRIRESELEFDSHMSGFVYRVRVNGRILIKKEIPGPDTIDEFLYEINALNRLRFSQDVIPFYGVVIDDDEEFVKGLLIGYAEHGALIDVLYDNREDSEIGTPWPLRARWARQIVQGLSDIHESGFVQGDFTLSNIVIDDHNDAKIIDINRRGCPVGWEPPEATPLIECGQPIRMYIGVKSDLYQLGMVLWALATQEDEPENHGRPLTLESDLDIPRWYRDVVEICLSEDPRMRYSALTLLGLFPGCDSGLPRMDDGVATSISVEEGGQPRREYFITEEGAGMPPHVRTVGPNHDWPGAAPRQPRTMSPDPYYHTRGRSPPSPRPSNKSHPSGDGNSREQSGWADAKYIKSSYSDAGQDDDNYSARSTSATPTTNRDSLGAPAMSYKGSMSDVCFSDATPKADEIAITVSDLTSNMSSLDVSETRNEMARLATPVTSTDPDVAPSTANSRGNPESLEPQQQLEASCIPLPGTPSGSACPKEEPEVLAMFISEPAVRMPMPQSLQEMRPELKYDVNQMAGNSHNNFSNYAPVDPDPVKAEMKNEEVTTIETQTGGSGMETSEEGNNRGIESPKMSVPAGSTELASPENKNSIAGVELQSEVPKLPQNDEEGRQTTTEEPFTAQPASAAPPVIPQTATTPSDQGREFERACGDSTHDQAKLQASQPGSVQDTTTSATTSRSAAETTSTGTPPTTE